MNTYLINIDELWLKGRNRKNYFNTLKRQIRVILKALDLKNPILKNEQQRLVVRYEGAYRSEEITDRLRWLPGINSVCPVIECEQTLDAVEQKVIGMLNGKIEDRQYTFKVNTRRVEKRFPISSMDFSMELGHRLLCNFETLKVDVKKPEISVNVKIIGKSALINLSTDLVRGVGGLPVGMSGHLVTLLSGGIDSPVASYLMATRGASQTMLFFHSYPYVGDEVKDKLLKIAKSISRFQFGCKLYVVPFGKVQQAIGKDSQEEYRTILFRAYMIKIAERFAIKLNAQALLTGDALAQVSSQTIENLAAIEGVSTIPIFRPLIGHNKMDIVNMAKKIDTFETSIIPHDDACSLFAPKHPVIRAHKGYFNSFLVNHPLEEILKEAVDSAELFSFGKMTELE